jgi:LacI family transcriptional regulator
VAKAHSKVTIADVARAAGVSKQTVSRVLNGTGSTSAATTARIRGLIHELGYRPSGVARSLATNSSLTLGLVVPALDNPYYAEVAQGAEWAAWDEGYNLFLSNVFHDEGREEEALRSLQDRGADGVILDTPILPDARLFELLGAFKASVVLGRTVPQDVAGSLTVDDAYGMQMALRRLAAAGRRDVALLAAPERFASSRVRRDAFMAAEEARGTLEPARILVADSTAEASYARVQQALAEGLAFDALICFNDIMAAGALRALTEGGVAVPTEVAVIGHDDIPLAAWLNPPLSTLRVSKRDLGMSAVRLLLDRLQGRNQQARVTLQPELIVRESSGVLSE